MELVDVHLRLSSQVLCQAMEELFTAALLGSAEGHGKPGLYKISKPKAAQQQPPGMTRLSSDLSRQTRVQTAPHTLARRLGNASCR